MSPADESPWRRLSEVRRPTAAHAPVRPYRVYAQVVLLTLVVLAGVALVGSYAARNEAESESVVGAASRTEVIADGIVEPALTDAIETMDPAALAALDRVVRDHVLGPSVVRVKLWSADGTILYSDEPRLIGERFGLGEDELAIIRGGLDGTGTGAEVTDLDEPENRHEADEGKLLEVYHPVRTPGGEVLLFETYAPYDVVTTRSDEIWRGFAVIVVGSLLALMLLMLPVLWRLLRRLRQDRDERELLLQAALDASDAERRRIAASLHDGVVQELAASSFVVAGAARQAEEAGEPALAASLDEAAGAVRGGIGGLRSLLVDIYPASLASTGLPQALDDLVAGLRSRDVVLRLDTTTEAAAALSDDQAQLVFQVAQETLRNAARHAGARCVEVTLRREAAMVVLEIADDGTGFDLDRVLTSPEPGHFGVLLLADAAQSQGAGLMVATGASGTTWRLEVPLR